MILHFLQGCGHRPYCQFHVIIFFTRTKQHASVQAENKLLPDFFERILNAQIFFFREEAYLCLDEKKKKWQQCKDDCTQLNGAIAEWSHRTGKWFWQVSMNTDSIRWTLEVSGQAHQCQKCLAVSKSMGGTLYDGFSLFTFSVQFL